MTDYLYHKCGGRWQPISGWSSRYRCDKCRVVGYRKAAVYGDITPGYGEREYIISYHCSEKGCERGGVQKVQCGLRKVWKCSEHSSRD